MKNITVNETRTAVIETLRNSDKALTLAEISAIAGKEIRSGSTNALVTAGVIRKAGKVKVAKTVYVEVETYELGENADAYGKTESK